MAYQSEMSLPINWPTDSDWTDPLATTFATPAFQSLQNFIADERASQSIFPPAKDVFNAFRLCSRQQTKVVILGQDPYHGPGQAHGLSFSVANDCRLPPSLRNIFKELAADLQIPVPINGNLTRWAEQGVLLLNTVMTVRAAAANSHAQKGWETFTDQVINILGLPSEPPIVFILWGKPAEKKTALISNAHTVIVSPHPSPLSAHRGFFASRPFSRANAALQEFGKQPIDWRLC